MAAGSGVVDAGEVPWADAVRDRGSSTAVASLVDAASQPPSARSTREWLTLIAHCQEVVNVATAAQDAAIARLAAIEREDDEDGTVVDVPRALGHSALDAPDLLSGVLPISHSHAEDRVRLAIRCAADVPGADSLGVSTGLRGLHEAMAAGVLDGYRASIVADELEGAPAEVASTVILALEPHLATDTPATLRRRCRRALARISPDLLRQRATRARERCGLRRWADEPGVDRWDGTFPSEDAAVAWAAIDALAQRYVADGTCAPIERARAKALTDLVAGQATVEITVGLTVPEGVVRPEGDVRGQAGAEPCDPARGAVGDQAGAGPGHPAPGAVRGRNDAAAGRDPSAVVGSDAGAETGYGPRARAADDLLEVGGLLPGDPVLVSGSWMRRLLEQAREPQSERARRRARRRSRTRVRPSVVRRPCDRETGALLDVQDAIEGAYRPAAQLAALVRARDRRCRFPGCSVAAQFCDLDHVRPWPTGPTSAANLMCVCRRHHRIKQRPGWRVRLARDGTVTWVDPADVVRVTYAVDALHGVVLPAEARAGGASLPGGSGHADSEDRHGSTGDRQPHADAKDAPRRPGTASAGPPEPRPAVPAPALSSTRTRCHWMLLPQDGPHSATEFRLEHALADRSADETAATVEQLRRQGVYAELLPAPLPAVWTAWGRPHARRSTPLRQRSDPRPWSSGREGQRGDDGEPPF